MCNRADSRSEADNPDRSLRLEEAMRHVPALRTQFGITRVAETTFLDRVAVPTASAYVPDSKDTLSVYSGKGQTRDEAFLGAVMEAVERQVCVKYKGSTHVATVGEIENGLALESVVRFSGSEPFRCVDGVDLLTGRTFSVPVGLVNPSADFERFSGWSTTGLAAGFSREEAMFHALFELAERHAWSKIEIAVRVWPRYLQAARNQGHPSPESTSDEPVAAELRLPSGNAKLDDLAVRISDAGLTLRVFICEGERWPSAAFATVAEPSSIPKFHCGMGSSWKPARAAERAVLEAISSRIVSIQGSRDDMRRPHELLLNGSVHGTFCSSSPKGRWFYDVPARLTDLDDLQDRATGSISNDVAALLDVMRHEGVRSVAAVELTDPTSIVSVVRVIVPELERFVADGSISPGMARLMRNPFLGTIKIA